MRRFTFFLIAVATTVGLVALIRPAAGRADGQSAPFVTDIPQGYRDWQWISSAHEAGNLNSLGAVLGNDVAIASPAWQNKNGQPVSKPPAMKWSVS